jgi:DNA repair exonuclease SbcCD nuclease subunit
MKFLLSSDWHADATTAGFGRLGDVRAAVEELVAVAVAERVDVFCFLGDLADPDSPGAHAAAGLACWAATTLAKERIRSRWLVGNHDALEDGSGSSVLDPLRGVSAGAGDGMVRVFDRPAWELLGGVFIVALPYAPRSHPYDPEAFIRELPRWPELVQDNERVLVLGHLNLEGIVPGSESLEMPRGREILFPIGAVLARFGDRAVSFNGHYHQQQTHRGVGIPGSLERLAFADGTGTPGYLLVEVT